MIKMKKTSKYASVVLGGCLLFGSLAAASPENLPAEFHVSPNGSDSGLGTATNPFATLERARGAARLLPGSHVILDPGTYRRTNTFELDGRDSGTTYQGHGARIVGCVGIPPESIHQVSDPKILDRLLPEVRERVLEVDLHALGITDFGDIGPRGFGRPYVPAPLELIIDGKPLSIARWPKQGTPPVPIGKVLDTGSVPRNGEKPLRGGTFEFTSDRPARWALAGDAWITGLFNNGYADDTVKIKSVDPVQRTITTQHPHMYGFASGKPWNTWTALNLLEEISLPGEFVADKATGKLFFLPPPGKDTRNCRVEVTVMKAPLVAIEHAKGVVFDGVDVECSRGIGFYLEGGSDNLIRKATLSNLGIVAVCMGKGISPDLDAQHGFKEIGSLASHLYKNPTFNRDAGVRNGVDHCMIHDIGAGAVSLGGGDRITLEPGGNYVQNCEIHDFNRWDRSYKGAVNINGFGNRVSHCLIHDAPGVAIHIHGNEHLIEYNEFHHVMMTGDDMGAIYLGRDPAERNNVFRYNYFHDIGPFREAKTHHTYAIYLDDIGGDGALVFGNIFRKAGTNASVFINGGSDIKVENNIFIDCPNALRVNQHMWGRIPPELLMERIRAAGYDHLPGSARYSGLGDYFDGTDGKPRRNFFTRNLLVHSGLNPLSYSKDKVITGVSLADNRSVDRDPGLDHVGIPGFQQIPMGKIGPEKP